MMEGVMFLLRVRCNVCMVCVHTECEVPITSDYSWWHIGVIKTSWWQLSCTFPTRVCVGPRHWQFFCHWQVTDRRDERACHWHFFVSDRSLTNKSLAGWARAYRHLYWIYAKLRRIKFKWSLTIKFLKWFRIMFFSYDIYVKMSVEFQLSPPVLILCTKKHVENSVLEMATSTHDMSLFFM